MSTGSPPDFTEKQLTSTLVYDGELLKVYRDTVQLPDGKVARREWLHHPGAVMMIPLLDEKTVIMERQFRYALRRHFYELPAGKMEPGEEPLVTAKRELIEECGYEAAHWMHLTTLHPCIGYADERIELFLARDLSHVGNRLEAGEFLEVMPVHIDEAIEWIRQGRITDVKTIIGLTWIRALTKP
jgi:ADP-ribose pyrophosphatase